jgi:alpha-galactosidase
MNAAHAARILSRVFMFVLAAALPAVAATPVVQAGDASISHDSAAGTWSLAAGGATLTVALDPSRDFQVLRLVTSSPQPWIVGALSDSTVTVNDVPLAFGSRRAGFTYVNVTVNVVVADVALQLDATFELPAAALRVTRHYGIASGSPTFEAWNTYEALGAAVAVSNLVPFQASLPGGQLRWLTGLRGDNSDTANFTAFTLQEKTLAAGEHFALGAQGRSSEQAVPMLAVDGPEDEFYVALMWSGAWTLQVDQAVTGLSLSLGLTPMTTVVDGEAVDGPHVLFGAVRGGFTQAAAALRSYALPGIRGGRPFTPLVMYNTWYAHGTAIHEALIRFEMKRAAALGVELFVVDAGWYLGAGAGGRWDFDSGLGSWVPDPARFPNGLKPLTDYAHSLGMRFGIWVEPERVALSLVGDRRVQESWLATSGGHYGSDRAAQLCFASAAVRRWVLDHLVALINSVQPDYLKWDNNMWINCDRPGHGHGATDGNFAHVKGLYDVLSSLRAAYPDLVLENVSGGGNRLDLGMLRFSDVAWMSDHTGPSVHVRHNLQGLSAVFPPAYLLSFVIDQGEEPLHRAADISLYFRSRMQGALGLSFTIDGFSDAELTAMAHEIGTYKAMRGTLSAADAALLSPQASRANGPAWDILQEMTAGAEQLLVIAVQSDAGVRKTNVKPTGLQPETTYQVQSVDRGLLGTATGGDLMRDGIDVVSSPGTAAHILMLSGQQ